MENRLSKKELIAIVVGIILLIVLTFGATYAYFVVSVTDTSGKTTVTGNIGGATLGTVTLSGGDTKLYLGISPYDMSESKKGTTYYSSTTEGSRETSKSSAGKTTYTATLSGDDTNEVMYACDYEFTVNATGTMLGKDSTENVEVVFEGDVEKTLSLSSSNTVSGTWYGFKASNKERSFNAYLQLTNTDSPQNDLAGTNATIEIENSKFECYLSKNDELVGEAYAIYTEGNQTLTFLRSETPIKAGETHNGETITEVYTGIEDIQYEVNWSTEQADVPWFKYASLSPELVPSPIENVIFEDEIRPISTAGWFALMSLKNMDLEKLNTSLVTDMSAMFAGTPINSDEDLKNFDTSNVTNMSSVFYVSVLSTDIDLSGWNTSNVTDMPFLFGYATITGDLNLNGWDVTNVTDVHGMFSSTTINNDIGISSWNVASGLGNTEGLFSDVTFNVNLNLEKWDVSDWPYMGYMFSGATFNADIGIGDWDVSNVNFMDYMFMDAIINVDLDLSGWNVSNLSNINSFDEGISGTGTFTPPKFNQTT